MQPAQHWTKVDDGDSADAASQQPGLHPRRDQPLKEDHCAKIKDKMSCIQQPDLWQLYKRKQAAESQMRCMLGNQPKQSKPTDLQLHKLGEVPLCDRGLDSKLLLQGKARLVGS